jgi:hypothetical protein
MHKSQKIALQLGRVGSDGRVSPNICYAAAEELNRLQLVENLTRQLLTATPQRVDELRLRLVELVGIKT